MQAPTTHKVARIIVVWALRGAGDAALIEAF